ncbi:MAG: FixH family protein [Cyclobacteriaceae bacterium]
MHTISKIFSILIVLGIMTNCGSDETPTPDPFADLHLVKTQAIDNSTLSVKIYSENNNEFFVGYNSYQVGLFDTDGELVTNSDINIMPMMHMEMMSGGMMDHMEHSAPHEILGDNDLNLHTFSTVFQMPSGDMQKWHLHLTGTDPVANQDIDMMIDLDVSTPELAMMKSFSVNDVGHFISLVQTASPEVGINDFEVTVYKRAGMMSWPAVEGLTIQITPEMPAMGHGSPNNVNPTHVGNGHYKGTVNFTMTGLWRINVSILEADNLLAETSFDITL